MALTPNIMMASQYLLANNALQTVPLLTITDQNIVKLYLNTITDYENGAPSLSDSFTHRLDDTASYISSVVPAGLGISTTYYTTLLNQHRANLFPSNQQFVLYALIAMGQVDLANKYVNSAINAAALTQQTFTSQDALMTGNLSAVSTNVSAWGEELVATGVLFNFSKLDNIGTPQAIVEALMAANMLGVISDELDAQGLDVVTLTRSIRDNPDLVLKPPVQKRCYDAFKTVTGEKLDSILELMQFLTPGIVTLDELLDLRKTFPVTFDTITAPKDGTLRNIFTSAGNLTDHFSGVTAPLQSVIPDTIAKSNFVLTCALRQVNGILNTTPEKLGNTAACIEENTGLPHTGGLDVAMPASTSNDIIARMGGGTGPNSTFYLTDLIGSPAGEPYNSNIAVINNHFTAIQADGGFDDLTEILNIMRNVFDDDYLNTRTEAAADPEDPNIVYYWHELPNPFPADVVAEDIVNGVAYEIKTTGTTNWITEFGSSSNAVGTWFTANANGDPASGNGVAFRTSNLIPAYGIYPEYSSSISSRTPVLLALMHEMDLVIEAYMAAYPTEHAEMLQAYNALFSGIIGGIKPLWDANLRWQTTYIPPYETGAEGQNGLPQSDSSTLLFAENLHQYGKKTDSGNIAEILEAMAKNNLGGNAIIAAMREGRNIDKLSESGVKGDNEISDKPQ